MMTRSISYFFATIIFSSAVLASEQTYIREYTYKAIEADSKITARAIALQEVKIQLLNELGTYVSSLVKQQTTSDGNSLSSIQVETLSAGVVSVVVLDEKWNGSTYVLKAQIKADPADVLKSIDKMLDLDRKQKQIFQLSGELSKVNSEKIQVVESLIHSKKDVTTALAEIARLKVQLKEHQTESSRQTLQTAYQHQVDQLTLNETLYLAWKNFGEQNYSSAIPLFQDAAEHGMVAAQFSLSGMYAQGWGVVRDSKQAVYWEQKAADQGYAQAQFFLGLMYAEGEFMPTDLKQALYWQKKAAEQGYAPAQDALGYIYLNGDGVKPDPKQALYWYQKAADQGFARAQHSIGWSYYKGIGITLDLKLASFWEQKAAEQGDSAAQHNLGLMYDKGDGVAQSHEQAVYWWMKAAEQGEATSQYALGLMYFQGNGVTSDPKLAFYWEQKAAGQGLSLAQYVLGVMYSDGIGVTIDPKQAVYWYQKAANQGDVNAQAALTKLNR